MSEKAVLLTFYICPVLDNQQQLFESAFTWICVLKQMAKLLISDI